MLSYKYAFKGKDALGCNVTSRVAPSGNFYSRVTEEKGGFAKESHELDVKEMSHT